MRRTLLAASIALSFSGTAAWAADQGNINDPGISNSGQSALNSSTGAINQNQTANQNTSNGTMTNAGTLMNGVQANDNSLAGQLLGSGSTANWGTLNSFNTRVVAAQNLTAVVTGNQVSGVGNVAAAVSAGGAGGIGGAGGQAGGGNATGQSIVNTNVQGGSTTNVGGTADSGTVRAGTGAVLVNPQAAQINGNTGGLGNGVAATVALTAGGNGGDAQAGAGGAGGQGTAAAADAVSGGLKQDLKGKNAADQTSLNNTGNIAGGAKGDSGNAKAKVDGGELKVIAGDAKGGKGGNGGTGGDGGSAKANAGFFNAGNWIDSAFSNGAGIVQSVQNSGIAASVVQAVNIQANIGAGR